MRRGLGLSLSGWRELEEWLPQTTSIGTGSYYAVRDIVRGRGGYRHVRRAPEDILEHLQDGLDAFLRMESYFFILINLQFVFGRDDANRALFAHLVEVARTDPERGWALASGFGRAAHFVSHSDDEKHRIIGLLPADLAHYANVGSGIPLINTITDDAQRFGRTLRAYPPGERAAALAGSGVTLAVAAREVGADWLSSFTKLEIGLVEQLRRLEQEVFSIVYDEPAKDLAAMRETWRRVEAVSARHVEPLLALSAGQPGLVIHGNAPAGGVS